MTPSRAPRGGDRGQATVELALALPVVALLALLLVQVGVVVVHQVLVTHAAREGARAAAVTADPVAVHRAALGSGPLGPPRTRVRVVVRSPPGGLTTVAVTHVEPTAVPVVGALLPDVTLTAEVTMRVER